MRKIVISLFALLLCVLGGGTLNAKAAVFDGKSLDTGIYWFGENNQSEKYVEGQNNSYFDPSKPTVIYIHGWQNRSTKKLHRETFNATSNDSGINLNVNSADYWVKAGWNIGIFYWNQFADEGEVKDAEAKIWTSETSKKLRWRKVDGSYESYAGSEKSVAEIFKNVYGKAMKNFTGSEIRLVGHSLGNQMVTNSSKLIEDSISSGQFSSKLRPNRVALLDPFWSKGEKSYLGGDWTGEVCREYVTKLKEKGIVFEEYKSSNINDLLIGDSNLDMRKLAVFTDFYPDYVPFTDQGGKHVASREWYFYSFGFNPPAETINNKSTGNVAASSSTKTSRLKEMIDSGYMWYQNSGKNTVTVSDDTFEKSSY